MVGMEDPGRFVAYLENLIAASIASAPEFEKKHRWIPSCVLATSASASNPGSSAASS